MNGAMLGVMCCLAGFLMAWFGFELLLFRVSCSLCGVPLPSMLRSVGIVLSLLVAPIFVEAVLFAILQEAYTASNYPLWEADLVFAFLALPIHMVMCSAVHARMMQVRVRECLGVWFVEKTIKFALVLPVVGLSVLILLAAPAKG